MAVSLDQFVDQIAESALLSRADMQALVDALPAERRPKDGEQLTRLLVRHKELTEFQAQQISTGKGKSLVMGNYVILDKLGEGGMGVVLKAEHKRMKRVVAVKILSPEVTNSPEALRRFQREVEAAAKLEHPNIVIAHDADEADDTHFLVMQYVDGTDLSAIVRERGPLAVDQAVSCVLQAARGLQYAHALGVVHRDIKPSNLLLDAGGTVKILDMGLARLEAAGADQDQLTGKDQIMGTIDYMAPEQALDTSTADARADIYSLGVTLWFLLTGRAVYSGDSMMAKLLAHRQSPIPSLGAACPSTPPQLNEVFARMVAKTPEDRYQSMSAVMADLERIGGPTVTTKVAWTKNTAVSTSGLEPTVALPSNQVETDTETQHSLASQNTRRKPQSPWSRNRVVWLAGGGGALLLLAAIIFFIQTKDGTIRVEINDPAIEVAIKGTEIVLKQADQGKDVKLSPGEHTLVIERGDFKFEADKLILKKGDDVTVRVELLAGKVQVRQDEKLIGEKKLPLSPLAVARFTAEQAKPRQQAWAQQLGIPAERNIDLPGGEKLTLVLIPPGEFMMGSTAEQQARLMEEAKAADEMWAIDHIRSEGPQHRVRITRPFYLGKYEVTQAQWQAVMGSNPSTFKDNPTHPVEQVSWDDIQPFLTKLNEGAFAEEMKFALPTEAQWEYACRAGTTTPWHSDSEAALQEHGWFKLNSGRKTQPVGKLRPNAFGLYDLHGNVFEWCADYFAAGYYAKAPVDDPSGPTGSNRVNRGGALNIDARYCRSAYRFFYPQDYRFHNLGFRLALVVAEK